MKSDLKLENENAEKILKEGWRLFQQKGYRGISMDELCRNCGITKPTLYYYFNDKENLFVQVLKFKLAEFHTILGMDGGLEQRLQAFAAAVLDSFQTEYTSLMHDREHLTHPENQAAIREAFYNDFFNPLNQVMQQGMDERTLHADRAETLTLIFLGMINNFIRPGRDRNTDSREMAKMLTNYFINGARKE